MGTCIEKIEHSCGTLKGLQVFEEKDGTINGFCFACNEWVDNPYENRPDDYVPPKPKTKSAEEIQEEIELIRSCQAKDLPDRKLKAEYLKYFNVRIGVSTEDGTSPAIAFFPYRNGKNEVVYKAKHLQTKKTWGVGDNKGLIPFGWKKAKHSGSKRLIITEGEFDAIALFQMIKESNKNNPEYADFNPAVISLPNGAASAKRILSEYKAEFRRFKEIVLAFDMDEPGRKATEEAVKILPHAHVAELPEKDANDCLIKGRSKACIRAVTYRSAKPKNTSLVLASDLHEAARQKAEWGVSWPWKYLTEKTRGIRTGETYYFGAAQKMGKSEVVNAVAAHLVTEHKWKVMLAKPEEANNKTYKMLAGKVVGKMFHDPKVEFDYEAYDKAGRILQDKVYLLNLYQHLGWETLQDDIVAASSLGAKGIFIDPITNLTNGMNISEINTTLQGVAQELSAMAKDLDVAIFIFCHLNKPPSGSTPHDRGGKITTDQFAGSSAMGRSCNYMFGIQGNKDPELTEEERNQRQIVILDDREFGEVGTQNLFWSRHTGLFTELQS